MPQTAELLAPPRKWRCVRRSNWAAMRPCRLAGPASGTTHHSRSKITAFYRIPTAQHIGSLVRMLSVNADSVFLPRIASPACFASLISGRTPRPSTTRSVGMLAPDFVVTQRSAGPRGFHVQMPQPDRSGGQTHPCRPRRWAHRFRQLRSSAVAPDPSLDHSDGQATLTRFLRHFESDESRPPDNRCLSAAYGNPLTNIAAVRIVRQGEMPVDRYRAKADEEVRLPEPAPGASYCSQMTLPFGDYELESRGVRG